MRVLINPGHDATRVYGQPIDSGAVGGCYYECDIVKEVGFLTAQYLMDVGISTKIVQQDNLNGESGEWKDSVCQISNRWPADLFISIHCNSAAFSAHGTETLIFAGGGDSERLAECIQAQIVHHLSMADRGVKERPDLCVLRETHCYSVLVELGFISNEFDLDKLVNRKDEFARAIARGVTDYLKEMD